MTQNTDNLAKLLEQIKDTKDLDKVVFDVTWAYYKAQLKVAGIALIVIAAAILLIAMLAPSFH